MANRDTGSFKGLNNRNVNDMSEMMQLLNKIDQRLADIEFKFDMEIYEEEIDAWMYKMEKCPSPQGHEPPEKPKRKA